MLAPAGRWRAERCATVQLPNNLAELRRIYAMAIVEMIPEGWSRVGLDRNGMILLNNLASDERFDTMVESRQLQISKIKAISSKCSSPICRQRSTLAGRSSSARRMSRKRLLRSKKRHLGKFAN